MTPVAVDQKPPQLDSVSTPLLLPSQIQNPDGAFPPAGFKQESADPPLLGPPFLSNPETFPLQLAPPQLTEAPLMSQIKMEAPDLPLTLNLGGPTAAPPVTPDAQGQHLTQTRSPEPVHAAPGSAPRSPPGSSAVWKKNQGEHLFTL